MIEIITKINSAVNNFVWGPVMLLLLVGTGVYLTARTGCIQAAKFGYIMRNTVGSLFRRREKRDKDAKNLTPFQAVTTALAGTVGTGNIAGVKTTFAGSVNTYDVLNADKLIISVDAAKKLEEVLG